MSFDQQTSPSSRLQILIIGNGIAGVTAARHIRKLSGHSITIISSESKYFFSRTALMYVYMGHLRHRDIEPYESWFWEKNKIDLVWDKVSSIDYNEKKVETSEGRQIEYDKLVIACGSASNSLDIPGKDALGVTSLYSIQDLSHIELISKDIKNAVIIGGGLIGIELAEMLHSRDIPVSFLVRESSFLNFVLPKEEGEMIDHHILSHGIDLKLNTEIKEIRKNMDGHVDAVITNQGTVIQCDFVGITIGVHPNVDWLKGGSLEIDKGIIADPYLKTNIEDVYAIGDCAELKEPPAGRTSIEPIWYAGRMMGETVAHTICGFTMKYTPGLWYNSAKFFDIEYQVYGNISNMPTSRHKSLFWMHHNRKKSVRIDYNNYGEVIGFNLLGIRFRQEVCEKWINENISIENVLKDLELAFFEPEFSENYSDSIRALYQNKTGKYINGKKYTNHNQVYKFLRKQKLLK